MVTLSLHDALPISKMGGRVSRLNAAKGTGQEISSIPIGYWPPSHADGRDEGGLSSRPSACEGGQYPMGIELISWPVPFAAFNRDTLPPIFEIGRASWRERVTIYAFVRSCEH